MDMLPFTPRSDAKKDDPIFNVEVIPKELDIFWRTDNEFLPEGKTFDDLTEEEKEELRAKYRFDPLRPGIYQTITDIKKGL